MKNKLRWLKTKCGIGWLIAFLSLAACNLAGENRLGPPVWETNGWLRIQGHFSTNQLVSLEASSNLTDWSALAVLDYRVLNAANWQIEATNEMFSFLDVAAPSGRGRYYRFATTDFSDTNHLGILRRISRRRAESIGGHGFNRGQRWGLPQTLK